MYQEDLLDLAIWRSSPPAIVVEGQLIPVAPIPTEAAWTESETDANSDGGLANILGFGCGLGE